MASRNTGGILLAGGAIFAMFFGAGNIVFPPILGETWPNAWVSAISGFCLTGVFVPLLGLIAVVLLSGDVEAFFSPLGAVGALLLQASIMAIEGPFGIVPRCFNIAYGGCKAIFPSISSWVFCGFSCMCVGVMTIKKERVIPFIGKFLTPIKLSFLSLLVLWGLWKATPGQESTTGFSLEAFNAGILAGYQTYDLPGAIYFSSMAMGYLMTLKNGQSKKILLLKGIAASCISAMLLAVMYMAFICLGVQYSTVLVNVAPEDILPRIVDLSLGRFSTYVYSLVIIIACLTTAVAAISVWTAFITKLLRPFKVSYETVLIMSLGIAFVVSSLGFSGIVRFMQPVLQYMYPILIGVTLVNLWREINGIYRQKQNVNLPQEKI
ncbi:MAG: branched-chain amino acid transport system II carrier protein [Holosporales bacterium]|jgi:LIVCS family branched-chain amino acid:cation transporter|nr:branched-chain amino acid transport system II carrier protein [Holosporales bacterium]